MPKYSTKYLTREAALNVSWQNILNEAIAKHRHEVPEHLLGVYRQYTIPDYMEASDVDPDGFSASEEHAKQIFAELAEREIVANCTGCGEPVSREDATWHNGCCYCIECEEAPAEAQ